MKYYLLSIDTNGLPKNGDFNKVDLVSISALKLDFLSLRADGEDFFNIVAGVPLYGTEKFHGFSENDINEYGDPLELVLTKFYNYAFETDDDNMSNVMFIGVNLDKFVFPVLERAFLKEGIELKFEKSLDISHCIKLLLNCDKFDEALDIFNIDIPIKNSFNKMNGMLKLIDRMRELS